MKTSRKLLHWVCRQAEQAMSGGVRLHTGGGGQTETSRWQLLMTAQPEELHENCPVAARHPRYAFSASAQDPGGIAQSFTGSHVPHAAFSLAQKAAHSLVPVMSVLEASPPLSVVAASGAGFRPASGTGASGGTTASSSPA